ncbi:MAG: toll/interleukin-1 receptor domain-containing protein [Clostridia bacterium]|nr:toll/interleukin-1 receptor domain-containing protein [Clostridia bacterium]
MAVFKVESKNKVDIEKKPRVYFTCHPEDFEKYFKKVCEDIFKTRDCAIYYTEDMTETIAEDKKEFDLGRNNLFVIPVTFKLLTTPNRAMDEDIPYALKKHIPVLPIMMESDIDEFYSKPDKFGELQYLNPYSTDFTEISYEEKLKKYLESVLISDKLAKRVRAAFDAYIFLSYRKKDRKYANELMRLIHSNPECRDIAIWFDEFLIPGESFKKNIEKILNDCKLFALLVTPQLLEKVVDENGEERDNYVISTELPLARKKNKEKGIDIFAVEMEDTDKEALSAIDVKNYVNASDSEFRVRLLDAVSRMAITANNTPEHDFLIGLAYLTGIDVEINVEEGLRLIESSADAKLKEAMKMLVNIYSIGIGTGKDINVAITHQKRFTEYLKKKMQESSSDLLEYLSEELCLAEMEIEANLLKSGRNTCWRVIKLCRSNDGYGSFFDEDRIEYYIRSYILLGKLFAKRNDIIQSKECYEKANKILSQMLADKKGLLSNFTCGCLHYHLGNIYSGYPFYDHRYIINNFKIALRYFEQCDEIYSDQKVQVYINNCKIKIASEYEKHASLREEAIQIYSDLSGQYIQPDYQNSLEEVVVKAHCFYRLGVLFQKQNNKEKAKNAYQYASDISGKAREFYEDDFRCLRLFLLSSVKLKKLNVINSSIKEYKQLLAVAEEYSKRVPARNARQLLAELYFELGNADDEYFQSAYSIYETLCSEYPEYYTEDLWRFRRFMWNNKLLDESHFDKRTLWVISQDEGRFLRCIDSQTKKEYEFRLTFVSCKPLAEIARITITDFKCKRLNGVTVSYQQIEPSSQLLQVCPLEIAANDSKTVLIPDERVLITYKNGVTVEYGFCYG